MTEEEVEVVAEELAKIGGVAWYPGRQPGPLLRAVTERYREQARAVIAALERTRGSSGDAAADDVRGEDRKVDTFSQAHAGHDIRPGATVIYRPADDQRAYPCRVVEIRGSQAYLAPILRTCIGWISIESLEVPPEDGATGSE